jgi:hypothetical protein
VRIPLKWGTDSGDVGQHRSEATLVIAMITEVPHIRQQICRLAGPFIISFHHLVSSLRVCSAVSGAGFR